jgi:septation ring formation regulator EzrA
MDIDIEDLTQDQKEYVNQYRRINSRLESLMKQMSIIQNETKGLIEELEDLRKKETKQYKNGKK